MRRQLGNPRHNTTTCETFDTRIGARAGATRARRAPRSLYRVVGMRRRSGAGIASRFAYVVVPAGNTDVVIRVDCKTVGISNRGLPTYNRSAALTYRLLTSMIHARTPGLQYLASSNKEQFTLGTQSQRTHSCERGLNATPPTMSEADKPLVNEYENVILPGL